MARFVVKLEQLEGDAAPPDAASIEIDSNGRAHVRRPACFRGLSPGQLRQLILDVAGLKAAGGSLEAARLWLAEFRWGREMKQGKAPVRGKLEASLTVQVVDDLSSAVAGVRSAVGSLPAGSPSFGSLAGESPAHHAQLGEAGAAAGPDRERGRPGAARDGHANTGAADRRAQRADDAGRAETKEDARVPTDGPRVPMG